jgi:hypothetical protein
VKLGKIGAALLAAVLAAAPVATARAQGTPDDKAAQAAKEKRDKELAKAKEELEKKLRAKKVDPAPAIAFLTTLVESASIDVSKAKDLVDKVMTKKIPWDQAHKAVDKAVTDNPKDPKKVLKDLTDWINKWKPEPPKPDAPKPTDPGKKT